jgi:hypothetical protein
MAVEPLLPVIGFLGSRSPSEAALPSTAFSPRFLGEAGQFEGKNVTIE